MVHKGIYSAIKEKIQLKYNIEKTLQLPLYKCMVKLCFFAQTVFKTDLAQQSTIPVKLGIFNNQWLNLVTFLYYSGEFRENLDPAPPHFGPTQGNFCICPFWKAVR